MSTKIKFVEQVLRLEMPEAKKIKKALGGHRPLDEIRKLLAKHVGDGALPAWIAFNSGDVLDDVAHLATPMFVATGADEDEFYSEPGDEQLVLDEHVRAHRVNDDGDATSVKLAAKDLARITAYDAGGFLLKDIHWIDTPPATAKAVVKLLRQASDAYSSDIAAYEPVESAQTKPASAIATAEAGTGGIFLGGPARAGFYDVKLKRSKQKMTWNIEFSDTDGAKNGGSPVLADELIFAGSDSKNARCSATDRKGKVLWNVQLTKDQSWVVGSACVDRGVVYQAINRALFALDAPTGKTRWTANLSAVSGSPIVVGDLVYIGTEQGLVGLSLENGRKKWKHEVKRDKIKGGIRGSLAFGDGVFYFCAEDKLLAVDLASGNRLWAAEADARSTPSLDGELVYTWDGSTLLAIRRADGKLRWCRNFEDVTNCDKTIAVAADRMVTRADGYLVALEKQKGKVLWQFKHCEKPYGVGCASPCIAGDVVLCVLVEEKRGSSPVTFHAVDLATGRELWSMKDFPLSAGEKADLSWDSTPAVDADGTIFVQACGLQALR